MKRTRTLSSNLRLFGQCLLLGFFLMPVMAVGQIDEETRRLAAEGDANSQYKLGLYYRLPWSRLKEFIYERN